MAKARSDTGIGGVAASPQHVVARHRGQQVPGGNCALATTDDGAEAAARALLVGHVEPAHPGGRVPFQGIQYCVHRNDFLLPFCGVDQSANGSNGLPVASSTTTVLISV